MFVSFTVNTKLKLLIIFLFKILCRQCWKTAAVHQRMIMLDEWDEDIELAPLEPVVEWAVSTSTSFTYSTLASPLGGVVSGMVHSGRWKRFSCFKATGWWTNLSLSSINQYWKEKGWFRRGKLCFSLVL